MIYKVRDMSRQKMVALRPEQYKQIGGVKQEVERRLGTKFDWGSFLIGAFAGGVITTIIKAIIDERKENQTQGKKKKDGSEEVKK